MSNLSFEQLHRLLDSVFALQRDERALAILVDLPDARVPDEPAWRDRRDIALEWFDALHAGRAQLPFTSVRFVTYPNVGSNNNDLPPIVAATEAPAEARQLRGTDARLDELLAGSGIVLALTQLSATAPLKLLARQHAFRGATLPGFLRSMIPVLALDYEKVNARVLEFSTRMDRADGIRVDLEADGRPHSCFFDLRFRRGHASGGLMREPGSVGNLPSGEAYIVPYEGEHPDEPSRTNGELPVQFDDEIVVYGIEANRAVHVHGAGSAAARERALLAVEPAYGNMAEVGIGVLGEWGVQAVGSTLLDEKLGLHIAFGRSDHFGGITGPDRFRDRSRVVHIDRVYVESTQPRVHVREVLFTFQDGTRETIMRDGAFVV